MTGTDREKKSASPSGVRMRALNAALMVVVLVVSVLLLFSSYHATQGYDRMRLATDRYIVCQQNAELFREGSDTLTADVRSFAATGDPAHAQAFMEEMEVTRSRERALRTSADRSCRAGSSCVRRARRPCRPGRSRARRMTCI